MAKHRQKNKPKMAYSRNAFYRDYKDRLERNLERDWFFRQTSVWYYAFKLVKMNIYSPACIAKIFIFYRILNFLDVKNNT